MASMRLARPRASAAAACTATTRWREPSPAAASSPAAPRVGPLPARDRLESDRPLLKVSNRINGRLTQHKRVGRLARLRAQMVHGVGVAAELKDGRHRLSVAGVELAHAQHAVVSASPAQDAFDAALAGDGPGVHLRL